MIDKNNYNLLEHNTFGINEECRRYVSFNTEEELMQLLHACSSAFRPPTIDSRRGKQHPLDKKIRGNRLAFSNTWHRGD